MDEDNEEMIIRKSRDGGFAVFAKETVHDESPVFLRAFTEAAELLEWLTPTIPAWEGVAED